MNSRVDRNNVPNAGSAGQRTAVGYVRVRTDMQAAAGLSLDAQRAVTRAFCEPTGLRLLQIHEDVESGERDGAALGCWHRRTREYRVVGAESLGRGPRAETQVCGSDSQGIGRPSGLF